MPTQFAIFYLKAKLGMYLKWVEVDGLLAHDEFNECNVLHTGSLFTKPEPQSHSFPTQGKITAGEEVLPGRVVVLPEIRQG